jgi:hypothetical protein
MMNVLLRKIKNNDWSTKESYTLTFPADIVDLCSIIRARIIDSNGNLLGNLEINLSNMKLVRSRSKSKDTSTFDRWAGGNQNKSFNSDED